MHFELADEYLCDITIYKEWGMYDHIPTDELTHEQVIKALKGLDRCSSLGNDDHPEFAKFRNLLEEQGYIKTERGWWNGDRVLKEFTLNGKLFTIGEQFPSGAAIKYRVNN